MKVASKAFLRSQTASHALAHLVQALLEKLAVLKLRNRHRSTLPPSSLYFKSAALRSSPDTLRGPSINFLFIHCDCAKWTSYVVSQKMYHTFFFYLQNAFRFTDKRLLTFSFSVKSSATAYKLITCEFSSQPSVGTQFSPISSVSVDSTRLLACSPPPTDRGVHFEL